MSCFICFICLSCISYIYCIFFGAGSGIWIIHCVPHAQCSAGNYVNITSASASIGSEQCVPCPMNTYSSIAPIYDASRPLSQQCTQCPPNFQSAPSSKSISDCVCNQHILHNATSGPSQGQCGGCPTGTIYNIFTQQCSHCPNGMIAMGSSICGCPAG